MYLQDALNFTFYSIGCLQIVFTYLFDHRMENIKTRANWVSRVQEMACSRKKIILCRKENAIMSKP